MIFHVDDNNVQRMLARLASGAPLRAGLMAMAGYLKGRMSEYPSTIGPRMRQPFVSDRQRRYFFAALRDGTITVPYQRTGNLGKKWGQTDADGGMTQIIGNTAGYAPFVVGVESQSGYMAHLGWKSMDRVLADEDSAAQQSFTVAFRQSMNAL